MVQAAESGDKRYVDAFINLSQSNAQFAAYDAEQSVNSKNIRSTKDYVERKTGKDFNSLPLEFQENVLQQAHQAGSGVVQGLKGSEGTFNVAVDETIKEFYPKLYTAEDQQMWRQEQKVQDLQQQQAAAERARGDAERARGDAERARGDAERARGDAERAAKDAERARGDALEEIVKLQAKGLDTTEARERLSDLNKQVQEANQTINKENQKAKVASQKAQVENQKVQVENQKANRLKQSLDTANQNLEDYTQKAFARREQIDAVGQKILEDTEKGFTANNYKEGQTYKDKDGEEVEYKPTKLEGYQGRAEAIKEHQAERQKKPWFLQWQQEQDAQLKKDKKHKKQDNEANETDESQSK